MNPRHGPRPGGRSARIQEAVHCAVRELEDELGRDALTVPLVAERAEVTPSTIYRRWGTLRELLSDVAVERLRPDAEPRDYQNLRADLIDWARQLDEELASPSGGMYLRDALEGDPANAGACSAYAANDVDLILDRARSRDEVVPDQENVLDQIVAPILYRILFRPDRRPDIARLVDVCLTAVEYDR